VVIIPFFLPPSFLLSWITAAAQNKSPAISIAKVAGLRPIHPIYSSDTIDRYSLWSYINFVYFCAVAETGSFSRAAEQSYVSQPSLSQQIMKLEDELGARLFDRLGRSVRLTDVGKTFLPRARSVLRELEVAKGDVVERKDSISGLVTVGVIPTVAPYFLLRVLLRSRANSHRPF